MNSQPSELISRAFFDARSEGRDDWRHMPMSILKTRLLNLTNREFDEADYGASQFKEFVRNFPDLVRLNTEANQLSVEYLGATMEAEPSTDVVFRSSLPSIYKDSQNTLVRDDLWSAIVDYKSGFDYAWDPNQKIARRATYNDDVYLLPTLTEEEMAAWRTSFASEIKETLDDLRLNKLEDWVARKLATKSLPAGLKKRWKEYRSIHVVKRLEAWLNNSERFTSLIQNYADEGNNLAVGELYLTQLDNIEPDLDSIFAQTCASWASAAVAPDTINSISDLINQFDRFVPKHLASAVVHVAWRYREKEVPLPRLHSDLSYRLADYIRENCELAQQSPVKKIVASAITQTEQAFIELKSCVQGFTRTTPVTAKASSIAVLKQAHNYSQYSLSAERSLLKDLEVLIGPIFRKFCEGCERHKPESVTKRAEELRAHIQRLQESYAVDAPGRLAKSIVTPIIDHAAFLVEEGAQQSDAQSAPHLSRFGSTIKLDLGMKEQQITFSARLKNDGHGKAYGIRLITLANNTGAVLGFAEHLGEFDLAPGSERIIKLVLADHGANESLSIPVQWTCVTSNGRTYNFDDTINIKQQNKQPNWKLLTDNPPYGINPIKQREDLYGRDKILGELELYISSGTSTFLWGQKRVGKTSVLQVIAYEVDKRSDASCIILRMGELASLHEGQIAHTIAMRLGDVLDCTIDLPSEDDFGASLGRLIPFVEKITKTIPNHKCVVIIDEFDDLDPAFYTGERGKQFVKALRSLSEVGLTFFFVGSERMDAIYRGHASDLNKWANISLDRITAEEDCISIITKPVAGSIEYEHSAVMTIIDYCQGNPFYMHLLCNAVFRRCWQDKRTFVGSSDLEIVRRELLGILGQTNFAHFWEDNPVLSLKEKYRQSSENCLFLCCVASLDGAYESLSDLQEAQELFKLPAAQRASKDVIREIEARLLRRSVIKSDGRYAQGIKIVLPIFKDWLIDNAVAELLPLWCSYCDKRDEASQETMKENILYVDNIPFPIDEDRLLQISEKLVYLGKQIDVAQIRSWLKQFDDDNRIEVAFLLLKRLAEKGFIDSGATIVGLANMHDSISAKRSDMGGAWKVIRNRLDNLCITYVDSELKSGAATARELAKRMRPGKCAPSTDIQGWIEAHLDSDPIIIFVDDFSGSGNTLVKGLRKCWKSNNALMTQIAKEGRIVCCLHTAFSDAVQQLNEEFSDVQVLVTIVFDDDMRAFDKNAGIFEDDGELRFAKDVLLQIGRQLVPQFPLGYSDMGVLVAFSNTTPNNTLPVFWCDGVVNGRPWKALLPRASFS